MALQYCDIPLLSPIKFVPHTNTPGVHFDDNWCYNQIKDFESKIRYRQKWQVGDQTVLQITSTIAPASIKVYNCKQVQVGTIAWTLITSGTASVYHATINLDSSYASGANKALYLYFKCQLLDTVFEWISEPIHVAVNWPNTSVFTYSNSYNAHDAWFVGTSYAPKFRCEAQVMAFTPDRERASFVDELYDTKTLSATPFRKFKLEVGTATGVADWVVDVLNRIFACDTVSINGKRYDTEEGAKWDINRIKGYPLIGASIDIVPSVNETSNQQSAGGIIPGIVTGYVIESEFTGTSQDIEVEEITITS
jgi:hypothetical protein